MSDDGNLKDRVQNVLDTIRPAIQRDGGDVQLVDVLEDGTVQVELQGACSGCPMAAMTLKMGIEAAIREEIPEIKEVVSV